MFDLPLGKAKPQLNLKKRRVSASEISCLTEAFRTKGLCSADRRFEFLCFLLVLNVQLRRRNVCVVSSILCALQ